VVVVAVVGAKHFPKNLNAFEMDSPPVREKKTTIQSQFQAQTQGTPTRQRTAQPTHRHRDPSN